jgi:hypothetical protein
MVAEFCRRAPVVLIWFFYMPQIYDMGPTALLPQQVVVTKSTISLFIYISLIIVYYGLLWFSNILLKTIKILISVIIMGCVFLEVVRISMSSKRDKTKWFYMEHVSSYGEFFISEHE